MLHRNDICDYRYTNRLINMGISSEEFFHTIEKALPPLVSRVEASRITGGLISAKTLSNEDALRKGPKRKLRVGGKIGYTGEDFMAYLRRKVRL